MNSHKILWKTSSSKWIQILLCITPLFVSSCASVTYNETNFQIFDSSSRVLESELFESVQTVKNFFAKKEVGDLILLGLLVSNFYPPLAPIAGTAFVVRAFLARESDWKEAFTKTIAREITREIAMDSVRSMRSIMKTIHSRFQLLKRNNTEVKRENVALYIHNSIDEMLNYFGGEDSLFRKYPLMAAPLLSGLALLIIVFEPMAKALIPHEAMSLELSCKIRNIMLDYRPRAVDARLDKLRIDSHPEFRDSHMTILSIYLFDAMSIHYNQYGYSRTIPGTLDCKKGCLISSNDKTVTYSRYIHIDNELRKPFNYIFFNSCLKDDLGDTYHLPPNSCITDYALLVRHRVEQMFPDELLGKLCRNPPQTTGFGVLTIKLKGVRAKGRWDGAPCDTTWFNNCDPFVQLFIDGELQTTTNVREDTCCYDLDVIHISKKISKNAIIKIEVWDADYGIFGSAEDLVMRTEGTVDEFLKMGYKYVQAKYFTNSIDTISFWQDEYKDKNENTID